MPRAPGGVIIAARLQVKDGSFRDLPLTTSNQLFPTAMSNSSLRELTPLGLGSILSRHAEPP